MDELLAIVIIIAFFGSQIVCIFYQCRNSRKLGKMTDQIKNVNKIVQTAKSKLGLEFVDGVVLDDILHLVLFEPLNGVPEETMTKLHTIIESIMKKHLRIIGIEDRGKIMTDAAEGNCLHLKYVIEKEDFSQPDFSFTKLRETVKNFRSNLAGVKYFSSIDITTDKITITQLILDERERVAKPESDLVTAVQESSKLHFGLDATLLECKIGEKDHLLTRDDGEKLWAWDLITVFQLGSSQNEVETNAS